ncbi:MAG: MATE family efflux transporter [Saccharospirillaceae bacterium]|nr:MATE family efflux transporter [Pseudomonadales bacterium]NRB81505.1 MATE family efflux transporter [Saccharospirillaceae bacterium]
MLRSSFSKYKTELLSLTHLAWPILITQLAQMGLSVADVMMSGQIDAQQVTAVALGSGFWLPIFLIIIGISIGSTALIGNLYGAKQHSKIAPLFIQSLYLPILLIPLTFILLASFRPILAFFETPAADLEIASAYLNALKFGMPALIIIQFMRAYCDGLGQTKVIMYLSLFMALINIPLNYVFIFGLFGLPQFGGVGCGYASSIAANITLVAFIVYLKYQHVEFKFIKPDFDKIFKIFKIGTPIGMSLLIEVSTFSFISIFIAKLGNHIVASHQIAFNIISVTFMIPLSLSLALTIRVSHHLGAKDYKQAKQTSILMLCISLMIGLSLMCMYFLIAPNLMDMYINEIEIIKLGSSILLIAGAFQIFDCLQVTTTGALRAYQDTSWPMGIAFVAFWVFALPLGYYLTYYSALDLGVRGFWIGLTLGLMLAWFGLIWRLRLAFNITSLLSAQSN